ncbi:MAG: mannose-1-phosphate guanylyltransferase [Chloroflexi bacterium]|nr:mannose-1-phosphate guanylyltransferase [Chloroflexota bacterium]
MEHYYALIMAGGGGTRLWPMSRKATPKQFLPLIEDDSMFKVSVQRLAPLFTPDRIYVVAGEQHAAALRTEAPEIPEANFILEPYGQDSGPAAGLGVAVIAQRDPEATIALLTADHHIAYKEKFRDVLAAAGEIAQDGSIVTLGISPSFPSTAFGYIRRGETIGAVGGFAAYHSLGFTEKPDLDTAVAFLSSGEYSWNSGMFIWRADRALAEFERQQPAMHQQLLTIAAAVDTPHYASALAQTWGQMTKISLDYAIMEGADRIIVLPIDIGWSDVGSWDALFDVLALDEAGNGFHGAAPHRITVDTKNTLIYSDKMTVTIGVDNLIIVDTEDALLVCHKDQTQDVKKVVNQLRDSQQDNYL